MKPWTYVLVASVMLAFAYEVRAHVGDDYPTITALLRLAADMHPMVAAVAGMLIGHLFWVR